MRLVAQLELTLLPGERFPNKAIAEQYPERSLDAIRSLRHNPFDRNILERERTLLAQGSPLQHLRVGGPCPQASCGALPPDPVQSAQPCEHLTLEDIKQTLDDYKVVIPGLSDLHMLYEFFGVRLRKRDGKPPPPLKRIRRLPGKSGKAFKRRAYREHQRLFSLSPKVLLQELADEVDDAPVQDISIADIHKTYDDIIGAASEAVGKVGIQPNSLPDEAKPFTKDEIEYTMRAMGDDSAPGPDG